VSFSIDFRGFCLCHSQGQLYVIFFPFLLLFFSGRLLHLPVYVVVVAAAAALTLLCVQRSIEKFKCSVVCKFFRFVPQPFSQLSVVLYEGLFTDILIDYLH